MSADFTTGPISGRVEKIKAYLGVNSGARAAMTAQLEGIVSAYGSSISGSTIGEGEFRRLQQQVPKETDSPEVYAAKLARFTDELAETRARVLSSFQKSGKDIKNYEKREDIGSVMARQAGVQPTAPATVMIQGPSGGAPVAVRADQAEKYLSKPGYKKVD
jgi:hypothetical protein